MSSTFQHAASISLAGPPWNVTETLTVYIRYKSNSVDLFKDADCTDPIDPAELYTPENKPTGIYFYISAKSEAGTSFSVTDPPPITWTNPTSLPSTVSYGLIRTDEMAISIENLWNHTGEVTLEFDLNLIVADRSMPISIARLLGFDPAIIEKPEDHPR
ncbi:MAG: hypothetical protein AAGC60_29965 [Acidobacteriota bacterium]